MSNKFSLLFEETWISLYQYPGHGWKGPVNWGLSVLPSFCPFVPLSRSFLGIGSLVFSESQDGVRGPCVVVHDSQIFCKKIFCPKNGVNGAKMFQK